MNIPFKSEPEYMTANNNIGNSSVGLNLSKPNLSHTAIGYNNNYTTNLTNLFTDNNNLYYNTNNSINDKSFVNNKYLSSTGYNKRSNVPNSWSNYNLKDSYISNTPVNTQTFAYNRNASFLDGGVKHQWSTYQTVNQAYNDLEQVGNTADITPNDIVISDNQIAVDELIAEMSSGEETTRNYKDGWIRGDSIRQYQKE